MNATLPPFRDAVEHLQEELGWIRLLVDDLLRRRGRRSMDQASDQDRMTQFAVSAAQASRLVDGEDDDDAPSAEAELVRAHIDARVAQGHATGQELPIERVATAFGLDDLARRLLILLLGGEVDEGIRRLYTYAWDDFTRRAPTVEFLLSLVRPGAAFRLGQASALLGASPLVSWDLVEVGPPPGGAPEPFLARTVRLAPSVAAWCMGQPMLDPVLRGCAAIARHDDDDERLVLPDAVHERLRSNLALIGRDAPALVALVGPPGAGKTAAARAHLCNGGRIAIEVQVDRLLVSGERTEHRLAALRRDSQLLGAPLLLDLADAEHDEVAVAPSARALAELAGTHRHGVVVTARDGAAWFLGMLDQAAVVHLPQPVKEERTVIWGIAMADAGLPGLTDDALEAASRFPLTGGAIRRAATAAGAAARGRGHQEANPTVEDVVEACRAQLTPRLSGIAQRIVTTFGWEDLILPKDSRKLLEEIVAYARYRPRVFDDWGYARLLPYGRGLSTLFSGPPGTGKTMAAGIVAGELGMELFRIDLSRTVSKYIGETEKNLGRIFDEAARSQSILLFDEADSLFAKRTEVKSSVDRYANLEVNYLLQRMEDFEGVTILTTNFEGSLDDAFRRRIRYRVHFPAPDAATRAALWRTMIPSQVDLEEPVDADELAEEYDLTGGHIKNAAVRAAFFAAAREGALRMNDLRRAATLECEKLGRVVRQWQDGDEE